MISLLLSCLLSSDTVYEVAIKANEYRTPGVIILSEDKRSFVLNTREKLIVGGNPDYYWLAGEKVGSRIQIIPKQYHLQLFALETLLLNNFDIGNLMHNHKTEKRITGKSVPDEDLTWHIDERFIMYMTKDRLLDYVTEISCFKKERILEAGITKFITLHDIVCPESIYIDDKVSGVTLDIYTKKAYITKNNLPRELFYPLPDSWWLRLTRFEKAKLPVYHHVEEYFYVPWFKGEWREGEWRELKSPYNVFCFDKAFVRRFVE